jgi:two-component system cell cycle response regulator DivK
MSRILIVEDNELNAKLFCDLLEAHGHEAIPTRDGLGATELAREIMPDLVLMDIQLPEISGLDITRQMKADDQLKHIPIVAVTAFAMKDDEQKILQSGCEGYISKPISIVPFMETVESFLRAARRASAKAHDQGNQLPGVSA